MLGPFLCILFLTHGVFPAYYYDVKKFTFIKINDSTVSMEAAPIRNREYLTNASVWKYSVVSVYDVNIKRILYEERISPSDIIKHAFGPLIGGKSSKFMVKFLAKSEHSIGYGAAYYYLESRSVKGFQLNRNKEDESIVDIAFTLDPYSVYISVNLSCVDVNNNGVVHAVLPIITTYFKSSSSSDYGKISPTWKLATKDGLSQSIVSLSLREDNNWFGIDLGNLYNVTSIEIFTSDQSVGGRQVLRSDLTVYILTTSLSGNFTSHTYDKALNGRSIGLKEFSASVNGEKPLVWMVKLNTYHIIKVVIHHALGDCENLTCETVKNIEIRAAVLTNTPSNLASLASITWSKVILLIDPYEVYGEAVFPSPVPTNHLVLYPLDGQELHLAEVQAYESDDPNIALGKPTSQISTSSRGLSQKAINYAKTDFTLTKYESGAWWRVDLRRQYDLGRVVLYNRLGNCLGKPCSNRLQKITIMTTNVDGEPEDPHPSSLNWMNQSYRHEPFGEIGVVKFEQLVIARHVAVYATGPTYLSLSEVEIYQRESRQTEFTIRSSAATFTRSSPCDIDSPWTTRHMIKLVDNPLTVVFERVFGTRTFAICTTLRRTISVTKVDVYKYRPVPISKTLVLGKHPPGLVSKCSLIELETNNSLTPEPGYLLSKPSKPEIEELKIKYKSKSDEIPHLQIRLSKESNDAYLSGILVLIVDQSTDVQVLEKEFSTTDVVEIKEIAYGRNYRFEIQRIDRYKQIEMNSSTTIEQISLAPLEPVNAAVTVTNGKLTMSWGIHPQNYYDFIFIDSSPSPQFTYYKISHEKTFFVLDNHSTEIQYEFDIWSFSNISNLTSSKLSLSYVPTDILDIRIYQYINYAVIGTVLAMLLYILSLFIRKRFGTRRKDNLTSKIEQESVYQQIASVSNQKHPTSQEPLSKMVELDMSTQGHQSNNQDTSEEVSKKKKKSRKKANAALVKPTL